MVASVNEEMRHFLLQVENWPPHDRIILARKILESVEASSPREPRGYLAEQVIALLKIPQPAPGDEECRKILEEELSSKHCS